MKIPKLTSALTPDSVTNFLSKNKRNLVVRHVYTSDGCQKEVYQGYKRNFLGFWSKIRTVTKERTIPGISQRTTQDSSGKILSMGVKTKVVSHDGALVDMHASLNHENQSALSVILYRGDKTTKDGHKGVMTQNSRAFFITPTFKKIETSLKNAENFYNTVVGGKLK